LTELPDEAWVRLLGADPRPWILDAPEPAARWLGLTALLGRPAESPEVRRAHQETLADPGTAAVIGRLPDWEQDAVTTGHNSPTFAPNILLWLWRMGVRAGDSPCVDRILDQMLLHQDADGRFQTWARWRGQEEPRWGLLLCDTHAICEVLLLFGRGGDARVGQALRCMAGDAVETAQGPGWPCRTHTATGFRGPGRRGDICPQATLEALRALSCVPPSRRPPIAEDAARTVCEVWLTRGVSQPYMFGHGRRFKTVKWPSLWYDAYSVLDALSRYPAVWDGPAPATRPDHRQAVCELTACLVAYNFDASGRVTPGSCYRGFEDYSWGQKRTASPLATALLCALLRRLDGLAAEIAAVDVLSLPSSKGGTGVPVPPRT